MEHIEKTELVNTYLYQIKKYSSLSSLRLLFQETKILGIFNEIMENLEKYKVLNLSNQKDETIFFSTLFTLKGTDAIRLSKIEKNITLNGENYVLNVPINKYDNGEIISAEDNVLTLIYKSDYEEWENKRGKAIEYIRFIKLDDFFEYYKADSIVQIDGFNIFIVEKMFDFQDMVSLGKENATIKLDKEENDLTDVSTKLEKTKIELVSLINSDDINNLAKSDNFWTLYNKFTELLVLIREN